MPTCRISHIHIFLVALIRFKLGFFSESLDWFDFFRAVRPVVGRWDLDKLNCPIGSAGEFQVIKALQASRRIKSNSLK